MTTMTVATPHAVTQQLRRRRRPRVLPPRRRQTRDSGGGGGLPRTSGSRGRGRGERRMCARRSLAGAPPSHSRMGRRCAHMSGRGPARLPVIGTMGPRVSDMERLGVELLRSTARPAPARRPMGLVNGYIAPFRAAALAARGWRGVPRAPRQGGGGHREDHGHMGRPRDGYIWGGQLQGSLREG